MTVLIGGSVLLIAASAIALVFGWVTADESLIWTSIGASVGAGVLLSLAYFRSRTEARGSSLSPRSTRAISDRLGDRGEGTGDRLGDRGEGASDRLGDRGGGTEENAGVGERTRPITSEPEGPPTVTVATQPPPSTRPSTPAPGKPYSGTPDAEVVAIADRKKFHRPDCRYARTKGAERISRAAARRRDYDPCGICKP